MRLPSLSTPTSPRYPRVLAYQEGLLEDCRRQGYVHTILGRRRNISGIRPRTSYKSRNQPEREAINMQIQGSAADLIKVAMVNIQRRLKSEQRRRRCYCKFTTSSCSKCHRKKKKRLSPWSAPR